MSVRKNLIVISCLLGVMYFWMPKGEKEVNRQLEIKSPFEDIDIPYQEYTFESREGAIWQLTSGTTIEVPVMAFISEDGMHYTGEVILKYREFRDIYDVIAAGIPMDYGKEGDANHQMFETAGSFEIKAFDHLGNKLNIDSEKTVDIKFATDFGGEDYDFFELTADKNWQYSGSSKTTINPKFEAIQSDIMEINKKMKVHPIHDIYYALHFGFALDMYYMDDYNKVGNGKLQKALKRKCKNMKLKFMNIRAYEEISFKGKIYEAAELVWQPYYSKRLPQLKDDRYARIKKISGNIYELSYKMKGKEHRYKMIPIMTLAEFMGKKNKQWQREYNEFAAKKKAYEESLGLQHKFQRIAQVSSIGYYNYDKFYERTPGAFQANANFEFGTEITKSEAGMLDKVYYIPPSNRAFVYMNKSKEGPSRVTIEPGQDGKMLAIFPGNQIAILTPEEYNKIDWATYLTQEEPLIELPLHNVIKVSTLEEIRSLLTKETEQESESELTI